MLAESGHCWHGYPHFVVPEDETAGRMPVFAESKKQKNKPKENFELQEMAKTFIPWYRRIIKRIFPKMNKANKEKETVRLETEEDIKEFIKTTRTLFQRRGAQLAFGSALLLLMTLSYDGADKTIPESVPMEIHKGIGPCQEKTNDDNKSLKPYQKRPGKNIKRHQHHYSPERNRPPDLREKKGKKLRTRFV